ncbi:DUF2335 domain-containing protein [Geodermatophilus saharensis]|uniref:DUF2335 domain-containing protein n=1 Tax=Geodermatophilus saharensis TaxID=1137994 RepID=UPI00114090F7|nr:DUF2335 domain-containing protein [Geodermatophilus saharensis]
MPSGKSDTSPDPNAIESEVVRETIRRYGALIPSAEELKAYEEAAPGSADRVLRQAELMQRLIREQVEFSRRNERTESRLRVAGFITGAFIALAGLGLAAFLAAKDFSVAATVLGALNGVAILLSGMAALRHEGGHGISGAGDELHKTEANS